MGVTVVGASVFGEEVGGELLDNTVGINKIERPNNCTRKTLVFHAFATIQNLIIAIVVVRQSVASETVF